MGLLFVLYRVGNYGTITFAALSLITVFSLSMLNLKTFFLNPKTVSRHPTDTPYCDFNDVLHMFYMLCQVTPTHGVT